MFGLWWPASAGGRPRAPRAWALSPAAEWVDPRSVGRPRQRVERRSRCCHQAAAPACQAHSRLQVHGPPSILRSFSRRLVRPKVLW
eukprot:9469553-Pyramimonas_sp.AAC.1